MPTSTAPRARPTPALDRVLRTVGGVGRDLRDGGRDLYGDVETFVRALRRDLFKLGKALQTDVAELTPPAPEPVPRPHTRRARKAPPRRVTKGSIVT